MVNQEHLQPGCPWYELSEIKLPNVKWCEENLCSWVVNPANTWSNILYLVLGVLFMLRGQKANRKSIVWLGGAMIFMGMSSLIYHASYTFVLQVLDFLGMYVFLDLILALNFARAGWIKKSSIMPVYWTLVLSMTLITTVLGWVNFPIQGLIIVLGVIMAFTEYRVQVSKNSYAAANGNLIIAGIAFLLLAVTFSVMDVSRFWCDPTDHVLQGHAIWHIFSAIGLSFLIVHHERTKEVM
jgi:hypothetical protein